eukprot:TRINITY_DN5259_c0_g1_i2.p2 TRINITY_DN5259_c0_g1~~TRINITY_DN5259_c0_g1_i2.p2  ORF type:complete len:105 (+),score=37.50 TRINITY_DN5259_c0_g1_i2:14-328(+)
MIFFLRLSRSFSAYCIGFILCFFFFFLFFFFFFFLFSPLYCTQPQKNKCASPLLPRYWYGSPPPPRAHRPPHAEVAERLFVRRRGASSVSDGAGPVVGHEAQQG